MPTRSTSQRQPGGPAVREERSAIQDPRASAASRASTFRPSCPAGPVELATPTAEYRNRPTVWAWARFGRFASRSCGLRSATPGGSRSERAVIATRPGASGTDLPEALDQVAPFLMPAPSGSSRPGRYARSEKGWCLDRGAQNEGLGDLTRRPTGFWSWPGPQRRVARLAQRCGAVASLGGTRLRPGTRPAREQTGGRRHRARAERHLSSLSA